MNRYQHRIEKCAINRLYDLSQSYQRNFTNMLESYNHRKEILEKAYPEYVKERYSHIQYNAFMGVKQQIIRDLQEQTSRK